MDFSLLSGVSTVVTKLIFKRKEKTRKLTFGQKNSLAVSWVISITLESDYTACLLESIAWQYCE
jgi:hypothetical protein